MLVLVERTESRLWRWAGRGDEGAGSPGRVTCYRMIKTVFTERMLTSVRRRERAWAGRAPGRFCRGLVER